MEVLQRERVELCPYVSKSFTYLGAALSSLGMRHCNIQRKGFECLKLSDLLVEFIAQLRSLVMCTIKRRNPAM